MADAGFKMRISIFIILACLSLAACARKTGSIQVGSNQPAFQLNGEDIAVNPALLGFENMPEITFDTYSDGSISLDLGKGE